MQVAWLALGCFLLHSQGTECGIFPLECPCLSVTCPTEHLLSPAQEAPEAFHLPMVSVHTSYLLFSPSFPSFECSKFSHAVLLRTLGKGMGGVAWVLQNLCRQTFLENLLLFWFIDDLLVVLMWVMSLQRTFNQFGVCFGFNYFAFWAAPSPFPVQQAAQIISETRGKSFHRSVCKGFSDVNVP